METWFYTLQHSECLLYLKFSTIKRFRGEHICKVSPFHFETEEGYESSDCEFNTSCQVQLFRTPQDLYSVPFSIEQNFKNWHKDKISRPFRLKVKQMVREVTRSPQLI